jgi:hypothetical protein
VAAVETVGSADTAAVGRTLKTAPFGSEPSVEAAAGDAVAVGALLELEVLFMPLQSSGPCLFAFKSVVSFGNGTA